MSGIGKNKFYLVDRFPFDGLGIDIGKTPSMAQEIIDTNSFRWIYLKHHTK